jgi:mitochondrial import receptor subunit TOM40
MVPSQQQTMLQSEAEYTGQDFTLNAKAINPDAARATGIYTLSYLQSLSKQVAVGGEAVAQRMGSKDPVDYGLNAVARISGADWVATATMQQLVALQLSFWQRVSDKVELGSELQLLNAGQYRREAITSIAAKFDYKQCSIRVQADSQFKVALFMEERIFPGFSLLLSGELDHLKGTNRFGLGVNLEN